MGSDGLCNPFETGAYAQNNLLKEKQMSDPVILETLSCTPSNVVLLNMQDLWIGVDLADVAQSPLMISTLRTYTESIGKKKPPTKHQWSYC